MSLHQDFQFLLLLPLCIENIFCGVIHNDAVSRMEGFPASVLPSSEIVSLRCFENRSALQAEFRVVGQIGLPVNSLQTIRRRRIAASGRVIRLVYQCGRLGGFSILGVQDKIFADRHPVSRIIGSSGAVGFRVPVQEYFPLRRCNRSSLLNIRMGFFRITLRICDKAFAAVHVVGHCVPCSTEVVRIEIKVPVDLRVEIEDGVILSVLHRPADPLASVRKFNIPHPVTGNSLTVININGLFYVPIHIVNSHCIAWRCPLCVQCDVVCRHRFSPEIERIAGIIFVIIPALEHIRLRNTGRALRFKSCLRNIRSILELLRLLFIPVDEMNVIGISGVFEVYFVCIPYDLFKTGSVLHIIGIGKTIDVIVVFFCSFPPTSIRFETVRVI